jgi:shikimate dehydrogenase
MQFNLDTKLVFLLGDPLGHSLSAKIHNRWYEENGINMIYLPVEVHSEENLVRILSAVRVLPFAGLGITKPYKVSIMKYLDEIDPVTEAIGSANTVVMKEGRLIGYNTDGIGALRSLLQSGYNPKGAEIFCYGAGGAARSVCFTLASKGAGHIVITDVTEDHFTLAREINLHFPGVCTSIPAEKKDRVNALTASAGLVLNMTGIGMGKHEGESPADPSVFHSCQLAFDAIYNPSKSRFLADAEKAGAKIINGLGMFVGQAAEQLELWVGAEDPTESLLGYLDEVLASLL